MTNYNMGDIVKLVLYDNFTRLCPGELEKICLQLDQRFPHMPNRTTLCSYYLEHRGKIFNISTGDTPVTSPDRSQIGF